MTRLGWVVLLSNFIIQIRNPISRYLMFNLWLYAARFQTDEISLLAGLPSTTPQKLKPIQLTKCPAVCRGCGCCHCCASILVNISKRESVPFVKKKAYCKFGGTQTQTKFRHRVKHSVLILTVAQLKAWWAQCEEVTWLIMHFNRRKIMQRKLKGTRNQRERETEGKKNRDGGREVWEEKLINVFGVTSTNKQTNRAWGVV